ncbi:MAG TPA: hypothetical protein VHB79_37285 [Polyangiaceae bacterium]|nr:hypothetical protein [Polyangiaceae bacterium]
MSSAPPVWNWIVAGLTALAAGGCAGNSLLQAPRWEPTGTPLAASSVDDSILCRAIAEHFVALPTVDPKWSSGGTAVGPAPSAGRWWVSHCSATSHGAELVVALRGPGWYWVDQSSSGIQVRQQVPFEMSLQVTGRLREAARDGVLSLWFTPSAQPVVQVTAPAALDVAPVNAWGNFLGWVPGVSPAQAAARRFKQDLTQALQSQVQAGATFTYDLRSGQADTALGQLPPGKTPSAALSDEPTWSINERLLLAPDGVQVLGPIDPGALTMNLIVEQGPGVSYRALCQQALRENYPAIRDGAFSSVPQSAWLLSNTVSGLGERTSPLRVEGCKVYLVVSSSSKAYTLASLRVRS